MLEWGGGGAQEDEALLLNLVYSSKHLIHKLYESLTLIGNHLNKIKYIFLYSKCFTSSPNIIIKFMNENVSTNFRT